MGSKGPTPLKEAEMSGFQPRVDRRAAGRRWGHRDLVRIKEASDTLGTSAWERRLALWRLPPRPASLWRAAWGLEFSCSITDSPWTPQEAWDSTPCHPTAAVTQGAPAKDRTAPPV